MGLAVALATEGATGIAVTEFAPAKVNLCLHVTGQRADGYHLLDSLVVFAGVGDRLTGGFATASSLHLQGPFGAALTAGPDNLVLRAAALHAPDQPVAFTLEKNLPLASGIGGGSADAAAAVRLIDRLTGQRRWQEPGVAAALAVLGADIPVCLDHAPRRMSGIGEHLSPVADLPPGWMLLVNPGVEVPTPAVFRALSCKTNAPLPDTLPHWGNLGADLAALADWLLLQRNDLEAPALQIAPVIGAVLAALRAQPGQRIARMSGSGATCFALFAQQTEADAAASALRSAHPGWWVAAAPLLA